MQCEPLFPLESTVPGPGYCHRSLSFRLLCLWLLRFLLLVYFSFISLLENVVKARSWDVSFCVAYRLLYAPCRKCMCCLCSCFLGLPAFPSSVGICHVVDGTSQGVKSFPLYPDPIKKQFSVCSFAFSMSVKCGWLSPLFFKHILGTVC